MTVALSLLHPTPLHVSQYRVFKEGSQEANALRGSIQEALREKREES